MNAPTEGGPDALQRFAAGALMAVGGMIALSCGSCTLWFGGPALWNILRGVIGLDLPISGYGVGINLVILAMALVVGGIPTAVGAAVFADGYRRFRRLKRPQG